MKKLITIWTIIGLLLTVSGTKGRRKMNKMMRIVGFFIVCIITMMPTLLQAANISCFYNASYVDTTREGPNLKTTLENLGHTVNTFTGFTASDFTSAISSGDLLFFPEMEKGNLNSALDSSARNVLRNYVNGGGGIIQANTFPANENLPNTLFGYSLVAGSAHLGATSLDSAAAAGTSFAGGPASLPGLDAVQGMMAVPLSSSLPSGALNIYHDATESSVFAATYGSGNYVFLGFDWYASVTSDWEDVTDRAITHVIPEPVIEAVVDIKPRSCPNPLNVKSKGVLPVAILGSGDFDVTTIDVASIELAGVQPIRSNYEDVAAPVLDGQECECTTEGPDGYLDLTLKFESQKIVEALGEVIDGEVLPLTLTGVLYDETPMEGADCILIRGRHKPINPADINKDGVVDGVDFAIIAENWLHSSVAED